MTRRNADGPARIVLTGGPGGGKTTAADLLRREIGEEVVVVPEAATLLFSGGFPRLAGSEAQRSTQRAIFQVQVGLEDVYSRAYPERVLLCDRGTIDGAAFWPPNDGRGFFASVGSNLEQELSRYDAVIFFETAAVGGCQIEGGNRVRIETNDEAVRIDDSLRELWSQHANYTHVRHSVSFFAKLSSALHVLQALLAQERRRRA